MDRPPIVAKANKLMRHLPSWYTGGMRLDQLFFFTSENPPMTALFETSDAHRSKFGRVMRNCFPQIGGKLLTCEQPDQFDLLLDEQLSDRKVARAYGLLIDQMLTLQPDLPDIDNMQLRPEFALLLGAGAAKLMESAVDVMAEQADFYAHILESLSEEQKERAIAHFDKPTLGWFVTDSSMPIEIREILFHSLSGTLCGAAMVAAIFEHRRISDWLGMLLVERFVAGGRSFLRLARSIPGVGQSQSWTPHAQVVDLERIEHEHRLMQTELRRSVQRHLAEGRPISRAFPEHRDGQ